MTSRNVTLKFKNQTDSAKHVMLLYTGEDGMAAQTKPVLVAGKGPTTTTFVLDGSGESAAADANRSYAVFAYEGADPAAAVVNQWYAFKAENEVELDFGRMSTWFSVLQWAVLAAVVAFLVLAAMAFVANSRAAAASSAASGGGGSSSGPRTRAKSSGN